MNLFIRLARSYLPVFFFLINTALSFADITELNFRNYTVKDGLPSNEAYCILQDKNGYIWFSTDGGVCRFDGKKITKYTTDNGLADNVVFRMVEDSKGRIWFNTFAGKLNYYYQGRIYGIAANEELSKIANQGKTFFLTMCVGEKDTLYLGAGPLGHIYKVPSQNNYSNFIRIPLPADCKFKVFNPLNNNQFVCSYNNYRFGNAYISTKEKNLLLSSFQSNVPKIIVFSKYNEGYLYSNADGERLIIDKNGNCRSILKNIKQPILSIYVDKKKNIWIGIHKRGVLFYKNGDLNAAPKQYLSDKSVCNILEDNEGGMWFATLEEGIFYTPNHHIKKIPKSFFKDNQVGSCFVDSDTNLLIGMMNGDLYKFYFKNDSIKYGFKNYFASIISIAQHNNDYYFGQPLAIQDKSLNNMPQVIKDQKGQIFGDVRSFFLYSGDTLVSMYSRGICFMRKNGYRFTEYYQTPGKLFKGVLINKKELLLACLNGLWRFKDGKSVYYNNDPMLKNRINDIVLDKNENIWVATDKNGVIYIDHISQQTKNYSLKEGLPANKINAITIDNKGNAWVATNNGIAVINLKLNKITKYTTDNGLLNDQVKKIINCNNELWMSTDGGICICNVEQLYKNTTPPNVIISRVLLNNQSLDTKKIHSSFEYDQNNFSFLFDGLSFKKEKGCDFIYQLIGYDNTWHSSGNASANYPNLPSGVYTFEVYAINNDGVRSRTPAKFMFIIRPPFWKTWWFISLVAAIWLIVTYQFIMWRVGVFKKRIEEKEKINKQLTEYQLTAIQAQMNPHFIFNVISSIQNFILDKDTDEAYDYLAQFARLIRLILQHSKENHVSIEKELEMLKLYISLEQLRLNKKFDFNIQVAPEIDVSSESIPVMLIQPYIENSIWHGIMPMDKSKKGVINLYIQKQQGQLLVRIEDNGVGREKASLLRKKPEGHLSMAMTLNQKRLNLFNAQLDVKDKFDGHNVASGTIVELLLPPIHYTNNRM
ncbi:MAG: two-component regulator propeller domain-containing protein [Bacteroidota bacterium]